jgi:electron transport complex protein RnfB
MHTVVASDCAGCDLCVEPCPVDCIHMVPLEEGVEAYRFPLPESAHPVITRGFGARPGEAAHA